MPDDPSAALLQYLRELDGGQFHDVLAKAIDRNLELGRPWNTPTIINAAESVALPGIPNGNHALFENGNGAHAAAANEEQVDAIRKRLLEDAQDTRDAEGAVRDEVPATAGMLHRGIPVEMFGERGAGKSIVTVMLGVSAANAGERVLYLDRENGAGLIKGHIDGILESNDGWDDPLASERFVGRHYPQVAKTWQPNDFAEAIGGLGFTVVMFDSLREFLSQLGLDPDKEKDISAFMTQLVTPLVQRRIAVVMLDNVGHQEKGRPKGSASKLDAVPQAYQVVAEDEFSPAKQGRVEITCTRSRYGDKDRVWSMRVGAGLFELPKTNSTAPEHDLARQAQRRHEKCRVAMIEALRAHEPLLRDDLMREVRGRGVRARSNRIREMFAQIAADPTTGVGSGPDGYFIEKGL